MILNIDLGSPLPPYEQIRSQVATMATSGVLEEGIRLPTIRQLASDLGVAGGTVARAYRELETEGVIEARGRHGSFIRRSPPRELEVDERLRNAAFEFAVRIRQLGADAERAIHLAQLALESIGETRQE